MNRALFRILWQGFRRDYVALGMALVMPLLFFTCMVEIEQGIAGKAVVENIKIGVIDRDQSEFSEQVVQDLADMPVINIVPLKKDQTPDGDLGRWLFARNLTALIVIPTDFQRVILNNDLEPGSIEIIEDLANPVYRGAVAPVLDDALQQVIFSNALQVRLSGFGKAFDPKSSDILQRFSVIHRPAFEGQEAVSGDMRVSYSAAGLGVLFLLFAMAGGGATLIDEQEQGTLHRTLVLGVSPYRIILIRWLFLTILGFSQVLLMFLWGELLYGLDLFKEGRLTGFVVVTLTTAMSAAALGLALAVHSRSRLQLNGISTVLILLMSALGGSLFPRYLMSEQLQSISWYTFNAWSLVGYQKVMWYDYNVFMLGKEILVLLAMGIVFLSVALFGARRWL